MREHRGRSEGWLKLIQCKNHIPGFKPGQWSQAPPSGPLPKKTTEPSSFLPHLPISSGVCKLLQFSVTISARNLACYHLVTATEERNQVTGDGVDEGESRAKASWPPSYCLSN